MPPERRRAQRGILFGVVLLPEGDGRRVSGAPARLSTWLVRGWTHGLIAGVPPRIAPTSRGILVVAHPSKLCMAGRFSGFVDISGEKSITLTEQVLLWT